MVGSVALCLTNHKGNPNSAAYIVIPIPFIIDFDVFDFFDGIVYDLRVPFKVDNIPTFMISEYPSKLIICLRI